MTAHLLARWLRVTAMLALCLPGCSRRQVSRQEDNNSPKPETNYFHVDPTTAGSISGTIHFAGRQPVRKLIDMSEDPTCVTAHNGKQSDEALIVGPHSGIANVFVYVEKGLEGKRFETPASDVVLKQTGCWFVPRVLGLQTGQALEIINSDPLTHNIHPMPMTNHEWNHSQAPGDPPFRRQFTQSEVMIPVKCKIHNWMHAYLGVLDHPYFAVTDKSGKFELISLPPGTYTIAAWQESLGTVRQTVTINAGEHSDVRFNFK